MFTSLFKRVIHKALSEPSLWDSLRAFGESKVLRTAYVWVVIVPILSKALDAAPAAMKIPIGEPPLMISLKLPFSWEIFYFSSLFIAAAELVYRLECPPIVRRYKTFAEYTESGGGSLQIINLFHSTIALVRDASRRDQFIHYFAERFFEKDSARHFKDAMKTGQLELLGKIHLANVHENDAFFYIRLLANSERQIARLFCIVLYLIGLSMLGILFVQNLYYVIKVSVR
jgi:hypothetical protein